MAGKIWQNKNWCAPLVAGASLSLVLKWNFLLQTACWKSFLFLFLPWIYHWNRQPSRSDGLTVWSILSDVRWGSVMTCEILLLFWFGPASNLATCLMSAPNAVFEHGRRWWRAVIFPLNAFGLPSSQWVVKSLKFCWNCCSPEPDSFLSFLPAALSVRPLSFCASRMWITQLCEVSVYHINVFFVVPGSLAVQGVVDVKHDFNLPLFYLTSAAVCVLAWSKYSAHTLCLAAVAPWC